MNIKDLLVIGEDVLDGKKYVGYVCGCPTCSKPNKDDKSNKNRPQCLLTGYNGDYGNIKVYADTLEMYN